MGILSSKHPPTAAATPAALVVPARHPRCPTPRSALAPRLGPPGPQPILQRLQGPNSLLHMVEEGAMTQRITSPSPCLQPLLPIQETPLHVRAHWGPRPPPTA